MSWALSVTGTVIANIGFWLYGNKHKWAPVISMLATAVWILYNILNNQWPLLLPCAVNLIIQIRNLYLWRK